MTRLTAYLDFTRLTALITILRLAYTASTWVRSLCLLYSFLSPKLLTAH